MMSQEEDLSRSCLIDGHFYYVTNEQIQISYPDKLIQVVSAFGTKIWVKNCHHHNENDEPAVIYEWGLTEWWKNGVRHRDGDLPAVIYENSYDSTNSWYKNGKEYRSFSLDNLFQLQILIKMLYFKQKNKMKYHPESLVGKMIKIDLYKLIG